MDKTRKTVGLALGSGGIRGMVHVGVIRTLVRHSIPIDFLAGSSIGAWAAAHYALYQDLDRLTEETIGKKREKLRAFLEPTLRGGLVRGERMAQLLTTFFNDKAFDDVHIPLAVVATDIVTGQPVIFREGKLAPAVRASTAVPTIFAPVRIGEHLLVDGGLCDPVPDDVVRSMGADVVISVNLNNFPSQEEVGSGEISLTSVSTRSLEIMRHWLARHSVAASDVVIEPYIPYAGLSSWKTYFTKEIGRQIMDIGVAETEKALPKIEALLRG